MSLIAPSHSEPVAGPVPESLRGALCRLRRDLAVHERLSLVVAVSGGLDSVCLLHGLTLLRKELDVDLFVAHFDHAMRPESDSDARFVEALARELGLPFHTRREFPGHMGGLEAAARRVRYSFLAQVARDVTPEGQPPIVVVAHHADDQAETVLLNITRGSGLHGLAAMRELASLPNGEHDVLLLRPFLGLRRTQLEQWAARHNLIWRSDETNESLAHSRNRVRKHILTELTQINPNVVETLSRTAQVIAAEVDRLDALDESIVDTVMVDWQREQLVALDYVATATLPLNQRMGMLRAAIRRTFPRVNEVSFKLLDQLSREFDQPLVASGPHPLVERLAWSVLPEREGHASRLVIHDRDTLPLSLKEPWLDAQWRTRCGTAVLTCPGIIDVAGGWSLESQLRIAQEFTGGDISPWEAWMDADDTGSIALTTPQPGMRVAPLGMGGQTRTLGNLFTDRKIPRSLRSGWPIVVHADSGVVLWVCGVTLSQSAAVRPQSQRLLHLHWLYRASEGKP